MFFRSWKHNSQRSKKAHWKTSDEPEQHWVVKEVHNDSLNSAYEFADVLRNSVMGTKQV
jgi:hypothetical protein